MKKFKIALCQIVPCLEKDRNVDHALEMVSEAARSGAALIALPEMFYYPFELGALKNICGSEEEIVREFRNLAAKYGVYICTGSMAVRQKDRIFNRSYLIGPDGNEIYFYDKRMLFDVEFRQLRASESSVFSPGNVPAFKKTELCSISTVICYDIRFGQIVEEAVCDNAELLLVPAVFNQVTGPAHWELVMRSRAVENQLFLAAISQGKNSQSQYRAYGHSMVVSPWGEILAEATENEQIIYADIDPQILEETRNRLPLLKKKKELYN